MKSTKDIERLLQKVPVPTARGHRHFHFSSVKAARIFAFGLILVGIQAVLEIKPEVQKLPDYKKGGLHDGQPE